MANFYISPTGSGDKSGKDINNAAPIGSLNTLIGKAGAGGQVLLIADKGNYNVTGILGITRGGAAGSPVTIRGVDSSGNAADAHFLGTRPVGWKAGDAAGNELFKLGTGADHLVFENLKIDNVQTAFRASADISDLTIQHVDANNVRRFVEDLASSGTATIQGLKISGVNVQGFSRNAVRLQYDTSNVVIEDLVADLGGQVGDDFPIGVHLDGTVHNVTIQRATITNVRSLTGTYLNGDGFASERGVHDVQFIDTVARGNTDGGYDLKSANTTLLRTVSEENGRNYRLWGTVTMRDSVGRNPVWRGGSSEQNQIWMDTAANVTVTNSVFTDAGTRTKVFSSEGKLTLNGVKVTHAEGAILYTKTTLAGLTGQDTVTETVVPPLGESSPGYVATSSTMDPATLLLASTNDGSYTLATARQVLGSSDADPRRFEPSSGFRPFAGGSSGDFLMPRALTRAKPLLGTGAVELRKVHSLLFDDLAVGAVK